MPKSRPKITRARPTKEVSVMAWIEDAEQKVLFVRQAVGLRLRTLPGGKVKRGESLLQRHSKPRVQEIGRKAALLSRGVQVAALRTPRAQGFPPVWRNLEVLSAAKL